MFLIQYAPSEQFGVFRSFDSFEIFHDAQTFSGVVVVDKERETEARAFCRGDSQFGERDGEAITGDAAAAVYRERNAESAGPAFIRSDMTPRDSRSACAEDPDIYVRGTGSLSNEASKPLILVDGVERSFFQMDSFLCGTE